MGTVLLQCSCGKRIKAPGALPGRTGRCPFCGALLRIPELDSEAEAEIVPPSTSASRAASRRPAEHSIEQATQTERRSRQPRRRPRKPSDEDSSFEPIGFLSPPKPGAIGPAGSFRYPFWDAAGLAALAFYPPVLTLVSLIYWGVWFCLQFGAFELGAGGMLMIALILIIPLAALGTLMLGMILQELSRFLEANAQGELHHPRPEFHNVHGSLVGVFRCIWATIIGALSAGGPAFFFLLVRGLSSRLDTLLFLVLCSPVVIAAELGMIAILLYQDFKAAHPVKIFSALVRLSPALLGPSLVVSLFLILTAVLAALTPSPAHLLSALGMTWFLWLVVVYGILVSCRATGSCYYRHRARVGWFREKPQWGVR